MSLFLIIYLSAWIFACFIAVVLMILQRHQLSLFSLDYIHYISQPWKFITFVIATTGMMVIAPYTGDVTWDYFDAFFMAFFTWYSAPWVLGIIYKTLIGKAKFSVLYIALCCWLFSASWSYDLYILLTSGDYPVTWWSNLALSSVLYVCAGLMWNLEYWQPEGMKFGFMRDSWPVKLEQNKIAKIMWFSLPFMILVAALILSFVMPIPFLSW